jgi:ribulose-5-phosphate 4-epimerase/fuculose-1-phosphate aldolase
MPKKALSVTLDAANVAWLKGRARLSGGNVSDALDKVVTLARTGTGVPLGPANTSVVGMVDLSDDPSLEKAEQAVREAFEDYASRFQVHEDPPKSSLRPVKKKSRG